MPGRVYLLLRFLTVCPLCISLKACMYGDSLSKRRPYPKRDSAWAVLERAPVKSDGALTSSHWLSDAAGPALAIADLQVS